jgi:hypothetical protein
MAELVEMEELLLQRLLVPQVNVEELVVAVELSW